MGPSVLETKDLRLVQAIAESGGATQAARRLHLSQSAVSHQLRGLEERLGLPLFERRSGRLRITPAGQRLVEVARQVLVPLAQAELELRRGLHRERVKLRVATQCYTAYHWLPRALATLMAEHPQVELVLQGDVAGSAAEHLQDDRADLVLCVSSPVKGPYVQVPLFDDELVLALPRGHQLSRKPFVEGRDLAQETLIQPEASLMQRERVRKQLFRGGEGVKHVLRLPTAEAALDLVQAGLGVSILASFTLRGRIARGELASVRLTRRGLPRAWTGVFRKGSPLAGPISTLLDSVQRHAPDGLS
jgi:LysR family transcriptional regulator, regulator for metE and metH